MRIFHSDRASCRVRWCLVLLLFSGIIHAAGHDANEESFDPFEYGAALWDEANGKEWLLAYGCTAVECFVVTSENQGSKCAPHGTRVPVQIVSDIGDFIEGEAVCREYMGTGYNVWFLSPAEGLMRFLYEASDVTLMLEENTLRFELGAPEPPPPFGWW